MYLTGELGICTGVCTGRLLPWFSLLAAPAVHLALPASSTAATNQQCAGQQFSLGPCWGAAAGSGMQLGAGLGGVVSWIFVAV